MSEQKLLNNKDIKRIFNNLNFEKLSLPLLNHLLYISDAELTSYMLKLNLSDTENAHNAANALCAFSNIRTQTIHLGGVSLPEMLWASLKLCLERQSISHHFPFSHADFQEPDTLRDHIISIANEKIDFFEIHLDIYSINFSSLDGLNNMSDAIHQAKGIIPHHHKIGLVIDASQIDSKDRMSESLAVLNKIDLSPLNFFGLKPHSGYPLVDQVKYGINLVNRETYIPQERFVLDLSNYTNINHNITKLAVAMYQAIEGYNEKARTNITPAIRSEGLRQEMSKFLTEIKRNRFNKTIQKEIGITL
jgi:hypothetical protein